MTVAEDQLADSEFGLKDVSLANLINEVTRLQPYAIAVISDNKTVNYGALNVLVNKAVQQLNRIGLIAGSRVAFRFEDQFLHLIYVLAAFRRGVAHVSLYHRWPDRLSNDVARQTGAGPVLGDVSWPGCGSEFIETSLDIISKEEGGAPPIDQPNRSDDAIVLYTLGSGTTGKPRIIYYDGPNFAATILRYRRGWPVRFQERYYSLVTFDFLTGKRRVMACLAAGGTMVFAAPSVAIDTVVDYLGVDHISLVANHGEKLLESLTTSSPRFPRLKTLVIGGSPISEDLRQRLRRRVTVNTCTACGANEFGEAVYGGPDVLLKHPGAIGKALPGVDIKVVDDQGKQLPAGETGTVLWKADGMFSGYLGDPEGTAEAVVDGWFRPGDLGALASDGTLIFKGRADDMMIRNGVNIYPREIEHVLECHPGIKEAAALPRPSNKQGQIPMAAVTVRDGALTSQELTRYCRERLGPKAPGKVIIVKEMPRNPAGKIVKSELATLLG